MVDFILSVVCNNIKATHTIVRADGMKNPPAAPNTPLTSFFLSTKMIGDDFDIGRLPGIFTSFVKLYTLGQNSLKSANSLLYTIPSLVDKSLAPKL